MHRKVLGSRDHYPVQKKGFMAEETPGKENKSKRTSRRVDTSQGYLVYDSKKYSGCCSCMLACSLVHEGENNLSLSRIQITQDPYTGFPEDVGVNVCHQCVDPACVEACPTGALFIDANNGNVRVIDETKCSGCKLCFSACPYIPSRISWDSAKNVPLKCDLCINTPYWKNKGGPEGSQACIQVCALKALKLIIEVPEQRDNLGYNINLRTATWGKLGLPTD
jgi:protein NrfC